MSCGQVGAQAAHGVADVVGRPLGVGAQLELDRRRGHAVNDLRIDVTHPDRPARESSIRRVTWISISAGAAARADHRDGDQREIDVGDCC
jgi:hypothetical protein